MGLRPDVQKESEDAVRARSRHRRLYRDAIIDRRANYISGSPPDVPLVRS